MGRKRTLRPDELALWRKVAKSVTPMAPERLKSLETSVGESEPDTKPGSRAPAKSVLRASAAPVVSTGRPPSPVDRSNEKKVRKGRLQIDARIDLHGMTQAQALGELTSFLHRTHSLGYRTVLVITGKGARPRDRDRYWTDRDEPGVLRRRLPEWLARPDLHRLASGYSPAHARHGGHGAFYITLRRSRD